MKNSLKKLAASLLAAMMVFTFMPSLAFESYAAATTCHIGDSYYATLDDALDDAYDAYRENDTVETIVIDSPDAGGATVEYPVKIDVGDSGYDIEEAVPFEADDDRWIFNICKKTTGTVTNYAYHYFAYIDDSVVFDWDTTDVSYDKEPTVSVSFVCENGHDVDADLPVDSVGYDSDTDFSELCEKDVAVTYHANFYDGWLSDTKTVTLKATGHNYELVDEDERNPWWDGKKYDANGIPVVKNVYVECQNEWDESEPKEADVEFVESEPGDIAPTCVDKGEIIYKFKVLVDGSYLKDEDGEDVILTITDDSAPATGTHVKDDSIAPAIEYKAYAKNDDGEFLADADDGESVVDSKDDAEIIWIETAEDSAYAQCDDDVLTYRIKWQCQYFDDCEGYVCDEPVEVDPSSTSTAFYVLKVDSPEEDPQYIVQEGLTAANNCTAKSVETGTFDNVDVVYDEGEYGAQKVQTFEIGAVEREANTDFDPQHNSTGVDVVVVNPTHTEVGTKTFTCADCGQNVVVELPRVGEHTFESDTPVTVDPTCTSDGCVYKICSVCEAANIHAVDEDGEVVEGLDVPGAVVSEITPALGHDYVVLNVNTDVDWGAVETDAEGNYLTSCDVRMECRRCHDADLEKEFTSEGDEISFTVSKAADCTENDVVTFTVEDVKDTYGNDITSTYTDAYTIGPHAYEVKAVNFSADGKLVRVKVECANDDCLGEDTRTFAATSTEGELDEATGLTTFTASITDENLEAAGIDADEIDTTIPASMATKQVYDLSKAVVTVPNYDEETYEDADDEDVVVKIGNATIDPNFYEVYWPDVEAPELEAQVEIYATSYKEGEITAIGENSATFEVTAILDEPDGSVKVTVNGEDFDDDYFEKSYDGEDLVFAVSTDEEDAQVSYLIDGEPSDAVALKDVKYNEDEEGLDAYSVQYVIRYADGSIYTSDECMFCIYPAEVKLIKADYEKIEGADDPAIEYNTDQVFGDDDLKLAFEKHSEAVGTYKLLAEWDNYNYWINYPTDAEYLTLTISKDPDADKAAANAKANAEKILNDSSYPAEEKKAVEDALKALNEAKTSADIIKATDALNEKIKAAEDAKKVFDDANAAIAAAGKVTAADYLADSVSKVDAAKKALSDAVKSGNTADVKAKTEALNAAVKAATQKAESKFVAKKGKTLKAKKSKKTKIKAKKAFKVSGAAGKVTYKKVKVNKKKYNKKFTVSKTGKVTVKKGVKKGTYKLTVQVTDSGSATVKGATRTVTLKIKVK